MQVILIIRCRDPDEFLHSPGEIGVLFIIQIHISLSFRSFNFIVNDRRIYVQMFDQGVADNGNPHPELGEAVGSHDLI